MTLILNEFLKTMLNMHNEMLLSIKIKTMNLFMLVYVKVSDILGERNKIAWRHIMCDFLYME